MKKYQDLINEIENKINEINCYIKKLNNLNDAKYDQLRILNEQLNQLEEDKNNLLQKEEDVPLYHNPSKSNYFKRLFPRKNDKISFTIMTLVELSLSILLSYISIILGIVAFFCFSGYGFYIYEKDRQSKEKEYKNIDIDYIKSKIRWLKTKKMEINKTLNWSKNEINNLNNAITKLKEQRNQYKELIRYIRSHHSYMNEITQSEVIDSMIDIENDINNNDGYAKLPKH